MTNYYLKNYEKVVAVAKSLKGNSEFRVSKILFYLGLSYKALGKFNNAEKNLRALDLRYSNYQERLVLAQFLLEREKPKEAKELVEELLSEFNYMSSSNVKLHKTTFAEVKKLSDTIILNHK
jgi:lipopolysaccharide biosynthesis regulator YciM